MEDAARRPQSVRAQAGLFAGAKQSSGDTTGGASRAGRAYRKNQHGEDAAIECTSGPEGPAGERCRGFVPGGTRAEVASAVGRQPITGSRSRFPPKTRL